MNGTRNLENEEHVLLSAIKKDGGWSRAEVEWMGKFGLLTAYQIIRALISSKADYSE